MVLITVLKIMTDSLAWYIFAAFFKALFGLTVPMGLLMIPAAVYVLWMISRKYYGAEYGHQLEKFRKLLCFFGILPLLALFKLGDRDGGFLILLQVIIPPLLVFCLLQILLFRILRQDPAIYTERRFQTLNLLLIAGIGLLGAALSSTKLLSGISHLLLLIWTGPVFSLVSGILWIVLYILGGVIYAVTLIVIRLFSRGEQPSQDTGGLPQATDPALFAESVSRGIPHWVTAVLMVLAVILILKTVQKLFGMLTDRAGIQIRAAARGETRSRIIPIDRRPAGERVRDYFSPQGRIRRSYRKIIKLTEAIPENAFSEDIADIIAEQFPARADEIRELTALYRRARYEDRQAPVTAADAARAEMLEKRVWNRTDQLV